MTVSDLISRQDAIDAIAKEMPSLTTPDGSGEFDHDIQITDEAFVDCMQIINELPSAKPKTGEWIRVGYDIYECSLCHQNVMTKDIDCYSYCHRCGARMLGEDGEADETD